MSVLLKIAHFQHRHDELPNQELARELVDTRNLSGIAEIAENLRNKDKNIQADCIKVLYEIGYLSPELIREYATEFLWLIKNRNNRLVWGGMIALATIATITADELFAHLDEIQTAMEKGSIITKDNGVKILSLIAAHNKEYQKIIFPMLLKHLQTCRPKNLPQHSQKILPVLDEENKIIFIELLKNRSADLTRSELGKIEKVIRLAQTR